MFNALHDWGFKCSTNITPIISCNKDENGEYSPYKALDTGKANDIFVMNIREDGSGSAEHFIGNVNYGRGMLTWGHYPDLGRADAQKWWGEQYRDLLDWGLDFVWQDMTTPAMKASIHQPDCPLLSFPMDIMISDNEETRYILRRLNVNQMRIVIFLDFHSTKQGLPLLILGHVALTQINVSVLFIRR